MRVTVTLIVQILLSIDQCPGILLELDVALAVLFTGVNVNLALRVGDGAALLRIHIELIATDVLDHRLIRLACLVGRVVIVLGLVSSTVY